MKLNGEWISQMAERMTDAEEELKGAGVFTKGVQMKNIKIGDLETLKKSEFNIEYDSEYKDLVNAGLPEKFDEHEKIQVLDHGYIQLIESWGSDERIIEAARMSTGKGFNGWGPSGKCTSCGWITEKYENTLCPNHNGVLCYTVMPVPGDEKLLKYLYDHHHSTPFEMAGAIIEVQAPIFIFREWHRHRTQSYNEMSARYEPLPDVNYVPEAKRCIAVNGTNKQANGHRNPDLPGELTHDEVLGWLSDLENSYNLAERVYQRGLNLGIPKELARLPVPVGRYSRMRASTNLRNWLAFLTLRSDKNMGAQWEIRQFANSLSDILVPLFPRTMNLFNG